MASKDPVDVNQVFHALGDRTRRALLDRVARGPVSVSELATLLQVSLTAVGQHLEILENAGLVVTEKIGRVRTCRMNSSGLDALERWVREHRSEWERNLDRLGQIFDRED